MKKIIATVLFILISTAQSNAQSILGKWKTIDDETGHEKSIIEIYKKGDKYYGKILELLIKPNHDTCKECKDDRKDQPLVGLEIIRDLEKEGDEYDNGTIVDPKKGKVYKCLIEPNGEDKLDVRGYVGFSLIGRTQTWIKVQ